MNEFVRKRIVAEKCCAAVAKLPEMRQSGIYIFRRTDENGIVYFYAGQAVNIYNRLLTHWNGYQHIDLSLHKRKWKSEKNPFGWEFYVAEYCAEDDLDIKEKEWIMDCLMKGWQTYNATFGSQGAGKQGIGEGKTPKGYHDGVEYGRGKMLDEIRVFFEKYLDFGIKGAPNKIKERKLKEFAELMKGKENGTD